jgi:hypothetical protein
MNKQTAKDLAAQFSEQLLPAINQGGQKVNALGGSRHGLAQAVGMGKSQDALARALTETNLGAYNTGMNIEQNARNNVGTIQAAQAQPGRTLAEAAGYRGTGSDMLGMGANAMAQGVGMREGGVNSLASGAGMRAQGVDYLNQGANAMAQGVGYLGQGANMRGQGVNWMKTGAGLRNQAADAMGQGANWQTQGAQNQSIAAQQLAQAAQSGNQAALIAMQTGQVPEMYQDRVLRDAMERFRYQYQEPYQRLNMMTGLLGFMQPLGTQYGAGASYGTGGGIGPNPNYQSIPQALFGGAASGAALGGMGASKGWWG